MPPGWKDPLHATTETGEPPATEWANTSGKQFNTISAIDFSFFDELNQVVQAEPADFVDPDTVGLYASIGIRKCPKIVSRSLFQPPSNRCIASIFFTHSSVGWCGACVTPETN